MVLYNQRIGLRRAKIYGFKLLPPEPKKAGSATSGAGGSAAAAAAAPTPVAAAPAAGTYSLTSHDLHFHPLPTYCNDV
jgi:hypothetical protein